MTSSDLSGDAVQQRHDHDPGGQLERQQRAGDGDAGRRRAYVEEHHGGDGEHQLDRRRQLHEALTTTSTATVNVTDDADYHGVVTLTASAASVTEGP